MPFVKANNQIWTGLKFSFSLAKFVKFNAKKDGGIKKNATIQEVSHNRLPG